MLFAGRLPPTLWTASVCVCHIDVYSAVHALRRQAITYFVDSILPRVLELLTPQELQGFSFHVVGANLFDKDFAALHKEHVTYDGHASDEQLRLLYSRTRLVVAPLLAGVQSGLVIDTRGVD